MCTVTVWSVLSYVCRYTPYWITHFCVQRIRTKFLHPAVWCSNVIEPLFADCEKNKESIFRPRLDVSYHVMIGGPGHMTCPIRTMLSHFLIIPSRPARRRSPPRLDSDATHQRPTITLELVCSCVQLLQLYFESEGLLDPPGLSLFLQSLRLQCGSIIYPAGSTVSTCGILTGEDRRTYLSTYIVRTIPLGWTLWLIDSAGRFCLLNFTDIVP